MNVFLIIFAFLLFGPTNAMSSVYDTSSVYKTYTDDLAQAGLDMGFGGRPLPSRWPGGTGGKFYNVCQRGSMEAEGVGFL
jgi:hypothetical protein